MKLSRPLNEKIGQGLSVLERKKGKPRDFTRLSPEKEKILCKSCVNRVVKVIRKKDADNMELFLKLKKNSVICSLREGYLRISPHFYNTTQELDRLVEIIR